VRGGSLPDPIAELRWAASSGLMALTGLPGGPPLAPPAGVVQGLESLTVTVNRWVADRGTPLELRWEPLVTGRAALLGLRRAGQVSAGGTCRLLRTADGWAAVNLARPDDADAVPAITAADAGGDPWEALAGAAAVSTAAAFVDRVRLLGVPAARVGSADGGAACTTQRRWRPVDSQRSESLHVVDLSTMWAGPLAAKILHDAGALVTKVESSRRPDGARAQPDFYRWLHAEGQPEIRLDFGSAAGRRALRELVEGADVVIESSRPRALEQLGAGPDDVAPRVGRVWVSITGYGRDAPGRDWVAFGDDAAIAGGLVCWEAPDLPVFCGDAIADPVTGLTAAAAALEALATGGGALLDVSMAGCCRALLDGAPGSAPEVSPRAEPAPGGRWQVTIGDAVAHVVAPAVPALS
jgi:hypothetical protein